MNNITLKEYVGYNEEEILNLYKAVGWSNYYNNPEMLKSAYENSLYTLGAYVDNVCIGVIRVVGDGHSVLFVQDIIILPEYQRQGIGSTLLKTILEKYENVYQIHLTTANTPKTISFYESLGFVDMAKIGCVSFTKQKNYTES
ncbi:MAG: GNAT family N-acetyltransferase [Epulopiscium sp. Nele67-Bin004]|nr:MAG: GNAT family N-acetyltransferase [Epulopiscium sp. Nele67-Bin004]